MTTRIIRTGIYIRRDFRAILMSGDIQAIYFLEPKWSAATARKWLKEHGHKPIKGVHHKGSELRYRLMDPKQFKTFSTKKLDDDVYLVLGYR